MTLSSHVHFKYRCTVSGVLLSPRKAVWSINTLFTLLLLSEAHLCLRTNSWVGLSNAPRVLVPLSASRALLYSVRKMCQYCHTRHHAYHWHEVDCSAKTHKFSIYHLPCVLNGWSPGRKLQNQANEIYLPWVTVRRHILSEPLQPVKSPGPNQAWRTLVYCPSP